ncbi:MAG: hypothetical protein EXR74_10195 [Bdellovibrionales bacterium]|nr:hypothetical protein [Bdellovibrionales bacterium]
MSLIIKKTINKKEIEKEWLSHQLKRDPHFLTRRQFLGKGVAGATVLTFMPPIFSLMTKSQSAKAAEEFTKVAVVFCLPGGYSLSAEFPAVGTEGKFLSVASYANLGVPGQDPKLAANVSSKYGAPMWMSQRLFKAFEAASPSVKDNLKVVAGWHSNSQDDSQNNANIPSPHILNCARAAGAKFRVGGTQMNSNTAAGGRGLPTVAVPGIKPAVASTLQQVKDLLTLKKGALSAISQDGLVAATSLAQTLTAGAKERFAAMNTGKQLQELSDVASKSVVGDVINDLALDPRTDPNLQTAFGITATTPDTDPRVPLAANTKLICDGLSPLMVVQVPSQFDYHDGTANWNATNGAHDKVIQTLMPILEACAAARRSIIVMFSTDGATSFSKDGIIAIGDKSEIHGVLYVVLAMNNEKVTQTFLGGMKSNDNAGGSAETDITRNNLQASPSHEGHVLTSSILGMQGLRPANFVAGNISADSFAALNIFKT